MRDFALPGRSPLLASQAAVATSHPLASQTALQVLQNGGNAVDAAVAAVALLGIVEPQMTGVGGDCFALYLPAGAAEPIALNGSGRAPAAADAGWFHARGITEVDPYGPHSVTVPGAVAAWCRLVADHGTRPLAELLQPAIAAAERGVPVAPRVAFDWARDAALLRRRPAAAALFLLDGAAPRAGDRFAMAPMAATLRAIARDGHAGFYQGAVAEDIVESLRAAGGLHTLDDFAATAPEYVQPIATDYRGHRVWECPPNGQGLAVLMMLNVLQGYDLGTGALSAADRVHLLAEAGKQAYLHRDALFCDTDHAPMPVDTLLSAEWAERQRVAIRLDRAGTPTLWPAIAHEDTVYLCVVDRDGNAISLINSIFHPFGSTIVAPQSGVLLHNRGASFSLKPGHPNLIAPGKRPMHTIIPGMLTKGGRLVGPFGVMGGQYQASGQVELLSNLLDLGMDPQEALDAPRSFAFGGVLDLESGQPAEVDAELTRRGHRVTRSGEPIGGGQLIVADHARGLLSAGSDPRKDGCALGW
jgi:gamma-glutamyltranspeptidase/glutathione hydrolase